jgi:hypothetical protein
MLKDAQTSEFVPYLIFSNTQSFSEYEKFSKFVRAFCENKYKGDPELCWDIDMYLQGKIEAKEFVKDFTYSPSPVDYVVYVKASMSSATMNVPFGKWSYGKNVICFRERQGMSESCIIYPS